MTPTPPPPSIEECFLCGVYLPENRQVVCDACSGRCIECGKELRPGWFRCFGCYMYWKKMRLRHSSKRKSIRDEVQQTIDRAYG